MDMCLGCQRILYTLPGLGKGVSLLLSALILLRSQCCSSERLIQEISGVVGQENYTYYSLPLPGLICVKLKSRKGDADLYISDITKEPTYHDYKFKSTTCGEDSIEIPASFQRPVTIAVYGYVEHDVSEYTLSVFHIADEDEDDYFWSEIEIDSTVNLDPYKSNDLPYSHKDYTSTHQHSRSIDKDNEGDSFLWNIFIGLLKIIFDVLL